MILIHRIIIFTIAFLSSGQIFSQAEFCADAEQLCFGSNFSVATNLTNTPEPNNYQCMATTPNITWFKIEVASTTGPLEFDFISAASIDLDYIIWGPFNDPSAGCQNLTTGNLVDCDFSPATSFQLSVPTVYQGDIFLIGVVNYANTAGDVYIQPTSANQTYLQCDNIDANVINVNDEFCTGSMDGMIDLFPQGGQNGPYDVSLNGNNYGNLISITNLSNGIYIVGITDYNFNSNPNADTVEIELLNVNCSCQASVGNIEINFNGVSNDSTRVCINDAFSVSKLGGQIQTINETGGSNSYYDTIPYTPAVIFLVYSDYPNLTIPCQQDPNYEFRMPQSINPNFTFTNDAAFNSVISLAGITNNEFYVVPATVYYYDPSNWIITYMHQTCFDYGTVLKLQLLKEIQHTVVSEDCANDSMYIELTGGYPEFYPTGEYTITNVNPPTINTPGNANFELPFEISGFNGFTNYSFTVQDSVGCTHNINAKYGFPNLNFSFNDTTFCLGDSSTSINLGNLGPNVNFNFNAPLLNIDGGGNLDISSTGPIVNAQLNIDIQRLLTGCTYEDSLLVSILENPDITPLTDEEICSGSIFEPSFSSSFAGAEFGLFSDPAEFGLPTSDEGLNLTYNLENLTGQTQDVLVSYFSILDVCSSDTLTMNVSVLPAPLVEDTILVCPLSDYEFIMDDVNTAEWSPQSSFSDANAPNTIFTASNEEEIIIVNTTTDLCDFSDSIQVAFLPTEECMPEPYNSFSPNGDGQNDTWVIPGITSFTENSVLIFNRWGDLIQSYENYNNFGVVWDGLSISGNELPTATYFYVIEITGNNPMKGWVKLLK